MIAEEQTNKKNCSSFNGFKLILHSHFVLVFFFHLAFLRCVRVRMRALFFFFEIQKYAEALFLQLHINPKWYAVEMMIVGFFRPTKHDYICTICITLKLN